MNAETKVKAGEVTGLAKLREKFPSHAISKLPKPTKAQTEAVRADFKKGIRCKECRAWHHPDVVHLDYVGHAALTDRLLDVDPLWSWEPVAFRDGLPAFDATGGLWIKLTVCGVTRLGYGHAAAKPNQDPGSREKEVIGDALRNAAMRFGAALDLWHKGDLHADDEKADEGSSRNDPPANDPQFVTDGQRDQIKTMATAAGVSLQKICERYGIENLKQLHADTFDDVMTGLKATAAKKNVAAKPEPAPAGDILDDEIPY